MVQYQTLNGQQSYEFEGEFDDMSKLSGHYSITVAAIEGLRDDCLMHSTIRNLPKVKLGDKFPSETKLQAEGVVAFHDQLKHPDWKPIEHPAAAAVLRDIKDVFNGGHWKDEGQKHHFMRNLKSEQSEFQAYEAAKDWIKENALKSAKALNRRIVDKMGERASTFGTQGFQRNFQTNTCPIVPESIGLAYENSSEPGAIALRTENLFLNEPAEYLGYALHALQDSFSPSHVKREDKEPYAITKILRYAGEEKKDHDNMIMRGVMPRTRKRSVSQTSAISLSKLLGR